jgi:hypothetical protein
MLTQIGGDGNGQATRHSSPLDLTRQFPCRVGVCKFAAPQKYHLFPYYEAVPTMTWVAGHHTNLSAKVPVLYREIGAGEVHWL